MPLNIKLSPASFGNLVKKTFKNSRILEKASSDMSRNAYATNTLIMDAKSILAQQKVTPRVKKAVAPENLKNIREILKDGIKSKYEVFEEKVFEEVTLATKPELDMIRNKINPINSNNINFIKNKVASLIENADLRQEILNCKKPEELMHILKNNMDEIPGSKKYTKFIQNLKSSKITTATELKGSLIANYEGGKINKILDLLASKSINPEVLKIENAVKELGIKDVNFSNDLEQANLIKEAVEDLIKKNIPLPDAIKISAFMPNKCGGLTIHDRNGACIWLRTALEDNFSKEKQEIFDSLAKNTDEFKKATEDLQQKLLDEINKKKAHFNSTKNPKHAVYHEAAHSFESTSLKSKLTELTTDEMETAGEISIYAKSIINGREAMPEMFAKLMDGQKLTDKQMALYLKLGGIIPET